MRAMFPVAFALATKRRFPWDIVKLSPEHVKVAVFENDRVRVLQFKEPGHTKLPMHSHPAYIAVGLPMTIPIHLYDGKTSEERTRANEVATHSRK